MKKLFYLFILIIFLGIIISFVILLKISDINCSSQLGPCNAELETNLSELKGEKIFGAKTKINNILILEKNLETYNVNYIFPNSFEIFIVIKKARMAIKAIDGSYILIDQNGIVLGSDTSTVLPILEMEESVFSKDELIFGSKLFMELENSYSVGKGKLKTKSLVISLDSGMEVIFPLEGDVDVLLGSLNLILSRLNNSSEDFRISSIDLRYENPVLK